MSKAFLGIDISKSKFDVALLLNNKVKTKKFDNNLSGFLSLTEWLNAKEIDIQTLHVCMEATGRYSNALANHLFEKGYQVSVVNPARTKGFALSELSRNKTDKADAQLIARFCQMIQPLLWQPDPKHLRELQDLVHRLEALRNMYQQEVNRLEGEVSPYVTASIAAVQKQLSREINSTKKEISNRINEDPELKAKKKLLLTIPGIGEATIAQILAFIGNVEDFKNAKQLAAFIGLNPKQRQSGTSIRGVTRLSKIGDSKLRKAFYMPAIVAKRYNPIVKSFCDRLKKSGKPSMLIIGAAMRKLVHIVYGVLRSRQPFDATLATV